MTILENIRNLLIVSFGAVFGSNFRFLIYTRLDNIKIKKDLIILIINCLASFLLGLSYSILSSLTNTKFSYELGLFFLIGLLGSMSTFSTFIYDLFQLSFQFRFFRLFNLFFTSLVLGLIFLAFGSLIGG